MMRFCTALGLVCVFGTAALGLDYTDHAAICNAKAEAAGETLPDDELAMCTCAFGVINKEFGAEVVVITARWELEGKPLPEITDAYTVDQFYQLMEEAGPKIDAACGG